MSGANLEGSRIRIDLSRFVSARVKYAGFGAGAILYTGSPPRYTKARYERDGHSLAVRIRGSDRQTNQF